MRALLDVNVLIALLDAGHVSHLAARDWFAAHAALGWSSCAITQNGCLRIMSHARYANARPAFQFWKSRHPCRRPRWQSAETAAISPHEY